MNRMDNVVVMCNIMEEIRRLHPDPLKHTIKQYIIKNNERTLKNGKTISQSNFSYTY
jgi:hypothetical protein